MIIYAIVEVSALYIFGNVTKNFEDKPLLYYTKYYTFENI